MLQFSPDVLARVAVHFRAVALLGDAGAEFNEPMRKVDSFGMEEFTRSDQAHLLSEGREASKGIARAVARGNGSSSSLSMQHSRIDRQRHTSAATGLWCRPTTLARPTISGQICRYASSVGAAATSLFEVSLDYLGMQDATRPEAVRPGVDDGSLGHDQLLPAPLTRHRPGP